MNIWLCICGYLWYLENLRKKISSAFPAWMFLNTSHQSIYQGFVASFGEVQAGVLLVEISHHVSLIQKSSKIMHLQSLHAPKSSNRYWISVMSWDVYYGSLKYPKNFYSGSWGKDHHGRGRSIWWQALQQECEHVHPILDEGIRHLRHQKQSCTQYWKLNDTTCSVILTSSRVVVQLYHCRKTS